MELQPNTKRDSYTDLADLLNEVARDIDARRSTPAYIGSWDIGHGYGEGIYLDRGRVWYEYGPTGTWAAYDSSAQYSRHPMNTEEIVDLLHRVSIIEPKEMLPMMDRARKLRRETKY